MPSFDTIKLDKEWKVISQIGKGGFGEVYEVEHNGEICAIKLISREERNLRELSFAKINALENVMPVFETGEYLEYWALRMPLATQSLAQKIKSDRQIELNEAIQIFLDICNALKQLERIAVHRDIKPANILFFDGSWRLTDFGISRHHNADTETNTFKAYHSKPYTAPERWEFKRATQASDVYSLGIVFFEMVIGKCPFQGPNYRDQHLMEPFPDNAILPKEVKSIILSCVDKNPEARSDPSRLIRMTESLFKNSGNSSLDKLKQANLNQQRKIEAKSIKLATTRNEIDRREKLRESSFRGFEEIGKGLYSLITENAPNIERTSGSGYAWRLRLDEAEIMLKDLSYHQDRNTNFPFDVIASSSLQIKMEKGPRGYKGREHSLWFCDAKDPAKYYWYETAFMHSALTGRQSEYSPFALEPGNHAARALSIVMDVIQVAWPFEELAFDVLEEFNNRWIGWFGDAAGNKLNRPNRMPEKPPWNSWRMK